jgi:aspartate-semialdehyde dehydrogenase
VTSPVSITSIRIGVLLPDRGHAQAISANMDTEAATTAAMYVAVRT